MEKQLRAMGAMFNWENEVITCNREGGGGGGVIINGHNGYSYNFIKIN